MPGDLQRVRDIDGVEHFFDRLGGWWRWACPGCDVVTILTDHQTHVEDARCTRCRARVDPGDPRTAAADILKHLLRVPEHERAAVLQLVLAVYSQTDGLSDEGRRALRERVDAVARAP